MSVTEEQANKSTQQSSDEIKSVLIKMMSQFGVSFTYQGTAIALADIFDPEGLLPAIARRSDHLSLLCLGYGIGITMEDSATARLGKKVLFDQMTPDVLRYLMILDTMIEVIDAAPSKSNVALDEFAYENL